AAITPDGSRAYITKFSGSSVAILDTTNNSVIGTIPVGAGPAAVAITPDGSRAYVPSLLSGSLSMVDLRTHSVGTIPFGTGPRTIVTPPDGGQSYVSRALGSNTVAVSAIASAAIVGTVGVGTGPLGVAIPPDQPPRASLGISARGLRLALDGSASSDPDG